MKAFGFKLYNEDPGKAYFEFDAEKPSLLEHDILVENLAVALNPVDNLLRKAQQSERSEPRIVGFDSVGRVAECGPGVEKFQEGDLVFFAGTRDRPGTFAEYTAVDERIAALAPKKLPLEQAAAMPLTSLTAYELITDKFGIDFEGDNGNKTALIVNASGGVGSVAVQLCKLAGLRVIATASDKNRSWVEGLGADKILDHHCELSEQSNEEADYIMVFTALDPHWKSIVKLVKPFGHIGVITSFTGDLNLLKPKAASFHWEYMFAKSMYNMKNMATQGAYLEQIAKWLDEGKLKATVSTVYDGFTLENLLKANRLLLEGHVHGKLVLKR